MHDDVLRAVIGLEYQAALVVAVPLTTLAVAWTARQAAAHLRDRRAGACAARLVAWAEQVIPAKSARYGEVAALLSRRFPMLSGEQLEVLIESEVLDLKTALRAAVPATIAGAAAAVATTSSGVGAAAAAGSGQDAATATVAAAASAAPEATPSASAAVSDPPPPARVPLRVGGA